jgi:oxygen-independent coproporphyrinogen-3 oxidase
MHTKTVGIYIHIPFCAVKCPYCDFYSEKYSLSLAESYIRAVIRNIKKYKSDSIIVDSIYFGGGTPSILKPEMINQMIKACYDSFKVSSDCEITIECNPTTMQAERLSELKFAGINRISVGVQSANDSELKFLGRRHTAKMAQDAVLLAYKTGFENISCDVMLGFQGQTSESFQKTADFITSLPIKHISSYLLKIEENTPFNNAEIISAMPSDDFCADIYLESVETFEKAGFMQYEISNFAKPDYQSRHNNKYWKLSDYIGIGPSAHSFFNGRRYAVVSDLKKFCNDEYQTEYITQETSADDEEKIMLALRLTEGISLDEYPVKNKKIIENLANSDLIRLENQRLSLTPKGFLVSNAVICKIFEGVL